MVYFTLSSQRRERDVRKNSRRVREGRKSRKK
jgi:hypothetical protein